MRYSMAKRNELVLMFNNSKKQDQKNIDANMALLVKKAIGNISSRVRQKYSLIRPATIPDHVNYAKVENTCAP